MKKILVTGAGGFIAGELTKKLKEQGHEIVAVDKKPLFVGWEQLLHLVCLKFGNDVPQNRKVRKDFFIIYIIK